MLSLRKQELGADHPDILSSLEAFIEWMRSGELGS
jgi:hypothetical protein